MLKNIVDIYIRLSDQDRDKKNPSDESESIRNQRKMLVDYCKKRGWIINDICCDEDYSGADRNRPGWNQVLKDCEEHKCDIVLCKTQSRFSRDMEMVEKYIHGKFLEWGVRFVSVVDNADTSVKGNKLSRMFNGLMNEMYLDELSGNVKATLGIKRKNGEFVGSFAPYGYLVDPENKNHLVIDEAAAPVVRRIFDMYINGAGYIAIANALNAEHISPPCERKKQLGLKYYNANYEKAHSPIPKWSDAAIYTVLRRREYTGALVQGRETVTNYKTGARSKKPEEEWDIVENAHEPIISNETFLLANEIRMKRGRSQKIPTGECYSLARKVFCGECGNTMWKNSFENRGSRHNYLACRTRKTVKGICPNVHQIKLEYLETYVTAKINELLADYRTGRIELYTDNSSEIKKISGAIELRENEIKQNDLKLAQIYEDKLNGIITTDEFNRYHKKYMMLNEKSEKELEILRCNLYSISKKGNESLRKDIISKYHSIEKLDFKTADIFVDKVFVYGRRDDGTRDIKIVWKI